MLTFGTRALIHSQACGSRVGFGLLTQYHREADGNGGGRVWPRVAEACIDPSSCKWQVFYRGSTLERSAQMDFEGTGCNIGGVRSTGRVLLVVSFFGWGGGGGEGFAVLDVQFEV